MAVADTFRFDPIAEAHDEEIADIATGDLIEALNPTILDHDGTGIVEKPLEVAPEIEERIVRHLLLRFAVNEKKGNRLTALLEEIVRPYQERLTRIGLEQNGIREVIRSWLIRRGVNSLDFPGLYKPTLSTKCKGGKVKISDGDAFKAWLLAQPFQYVAEEATKTVEVFDAAVAFNTLAALENITVTAAGSLVDANGEVIELPGVTVEPESKTIQLRGAS